MTQITFYRTAAEYTGFTCSGHAQFADYGKDIVCAAISALVINTVNSLEQIAGEKISVETDAENGVIRCRFLEHPLKEASGVLVDSLVLGISQIEKQYGNKHCKLIFEEV